MQFHLFSHSRTLPVFSCLFVLVLLILQSCEKADIIPETYYDCEVEHSDSIALHPKAGTYQELLDRHQKNRMVGAVLLIKDREGLWVGAAGQADIASNVSMKPCNTFLIASISKVFTAAAIYRYLDRGMLSLDDKLSVWLPSEVSDRIANSEQATLRHLLGHRSGIPDFYTNRFELDRINRVKNGWTKEEVLEYIYDKSPEFAPDETYAYSNTNYLLLSIVLERVSGLSFEDIYQQELFNPLGLSSAYYSESEPIPAGCVRGYADAHADGQLVDSQHLYEDELGIGGDGGIAINAYDLAVFLEQLMKGQVISSSSLVEMTNWFSMPENWHWDSYGQIENGYGLEKFDTDYGFAVGHTGSIDGFGSFGFYFPEEDMTYVLLVNNTKAFDTAKRELFEESLALMFE